jgi:thiol-disulfide isomerase/thioredoxin
MRNVSMKYAVVFGIAGLALSTAVAGAAAVRAPRVSIASLDKLPQPLPLPYDANADADKQVAAARARAKAAGKRLIIDLGGNWCPDCRVLAGVMDLPELRGFLRRHYEIVTVDVGRFDRNQQIVRHYGIDKLRGVPALLIIDPRSDRLLNRDRLFALADARHMTPQALADWLAQWI